MATSLRSFIKYKTFGAAGNRLRAIRHGLLRGLHFHIDTQSKTMRLIGLDEREITSVIQNLAAQCTTALDIGANDGWYALYFASRENVKKVFAFEPDKALVPQLQSNFDANDLAFKKKTQFLTKMVGNQNNDDWISIDSMAAQLEGVVLFKIDVDGGELDVLQGATQTLKNLRCLLLLETHSPELERECIAFLKELGYESKIITPAWYRAIIPEARSLAHNQWFVAQRR